MKKDNIFEHDSARKALARGKQNKEGVKPTASEQMFKQGSRLLGTGDGKQGNIGKFKEAQYASEAHEKYEGGKGEADTSNKQKQTEVKTFKKKESKEGLVLNYANGPIFTSEHQTVTELLKEYITFDKLVCFEVWGNNQTEAITLKGFDAIFNFLFVRAGWQGQGGPFGKLRFAPGTKYSITEEPSERRIKQRFATLALNGHEA